MTRILSLVGFILLGTWCTGQVSGDFSENSLPLKETISFRSTAVLPTENSLKLGTTIYSSKMQGIAEHYLSSSYLMGKSKTQTIGLQIYLKDRGNLISETSAKFAFRQAIKLNQNQKISLATNVGMYQILLNSTATTQGGSDQAFDIDWSTSYENKTAVLSAYLGNTNQPKLTLLSEAIFYHRYYGAYAEKTFSLTKMYESSAQFNMYWQTSELHWRASFEQEVYQNVLLAVSGNDDSIGFSGAVTNWEVSRKLYAHLYIGYAFPISDEVLNNFTPLQIQIGVSGKRPE